jgi:stearoyl-CoA desaturase (delta-9 desaturase)
MGKVLLRIHVHRPGIIVSEPARVRGDAPHASRVQRHRKGPPFTEFLQGRFPFHVAYEEGLHGFADGHAPAQKRFTGNYPVWERFERFSDRWAPRILWSLLVGLFYWQFAAAWWMFLLLPVHFLMGPLHGAIVNWCGHKYGYVNFNTRDRSRNTLNVDILLMGELFQNNHHKFPGRPNFAVRWFEIDPTYFLILLLDWVGIIRLVTRPDSAT